MKKFYQVALVFLLICMMGALCVQCANGQSIPVKVGSVWYTIDDSSKQAVFFQTFEAQGCPANIYIHDTMWQIPGGFTTAPQTNPDVPQFVFITDTLYVPVPVHDTVNNCGPPPSPGLVSIFTTQTLPTTSSSDGQPITLGVKFRVSATAYMKGVRFYKTANNTGSHKGYLYSSAGSILDSGTFVGEAATGWQTLQLTKDIQLTAGTTYVAAYYSPTGQYSDTNNTFNTAITNGIITGLASGTDGVNGVYSYGNKFSISTFKNSNYWVDAVVSQTK